MGWFIEAMVKLVKNVLERADESLSDLHLAMLRLKTGPMKI